MVRRFDVQSHIEGRQNISGVEITAVVEFDTLTQGAGPDRQIFIWLTDFGQVRDHIRGVQFVTIERFGNLLTSTQGLTVGLVTTEQADRFSTLHEGEDIATTWITEIEQF